jgi:hypothetical protein
MSYRKHPMLPMLNKAATPLKFNQCIEAPLQGIHPCFP